MSDEQPQDEPPDTSLIGRYFDLQKQVHEHFGYKEDWVVIPLDDMRHVYWHLIGEGPGEVWWAESLENMLAIVAAEGDYDQPGCDGNDFYTAEIYTQRHLLKWVYRTDDLTMVAIDTHTDGNKFLSIFDNAKQIIQSIVLTDPVDVYDRPADR